MPHRCTHCATPSAHTPPAPPPPRPSARAPPQLPEYVLQGTTAALMLLTGNWVLGAAHAALCAWNLRQLSRREHLADVTEIFRQVSKQAAAAPSISWEPCQ